MRLFAQVVDDEARELRGVEHIALLEADQQAACLVGLHVIASGAGHRFAPVLDCAAPIAYAVDLRVVMRDMCDTPPAHVVHVAHAGGHPRCGARMRAKHLLIATPWCAANRFLTSVLAFAINDIRPLAAGLDRLKALCAGAGQHCAVLRL